MRIAIKGGTGARRPAAAAHRGVAAWLGTVQVAPASAAGSADTSVMLGLLALAVLFAITGALARIRADRRLRRVAHALGTATTDVVAVARANAEETAGLRASVQRLAEDSRQKDERLANTAHELRTPLTTIMAAVDMLRDGYATTPEERFTFMDQASAACHHLMFLLNDLLDTAAYEAGRLRIDSKTCFANDLLDDALRILLPVALVKNMVLDVVKPEEDLPFTGDPNRTLQVIFNLVGNALKYSPPQTEVTLRAFAREGMVVFEVEDRGIGVPADAVPNLFTRFGRVHDAGASIARGTGLGLYMCKVLIEQMHGNIGYRAARPGSVFWFELAGAADRDRPVGAAPIALDKQIGGP